MIRIEYVRPELPASSRVPCAVPVALPDREMSAADVTRSWGADRAALRICETRRAAVVTAVDAAAGSNGDMPK